MNEGKLRSFEHMWSTDKEHYMLSEAECNDASVKRYTIIDIRTNHGIIIDDDDVAREVVRRMLDAGVNIGNPFDTKTRKEIVKRRLRSSHEGH